MLIELFSLVVTAEALQVKYIENLRSESGWVSMRQILTQKGTSTTNHFCTSEYRFKIGNFAPTEAR